MDTKGGAIFLAFIPRFFRAVPKIDAVEQKRERGGLQRELRVRALGKGDLELEPAGPVESVPAPGREASTCPWIEAY